MYVARLVCRWIDATFCDRRVGRGRSIGLSVISANYRRESCVAALLPWLKPLERFIQLLLFTIFLILSSVVLKYPLEHCPKCPFIHIYICFSASTGLRRVLGGICHRRASEVCLGGPEWKLAVPAVTAVPSVVPSAPLFIFVRYSQKRNAEVKIVKIHDTPYSPNAWAKLAYY